MKSWVNHRQKQAKAHPFCKIKKWAQKHPHFIKIQRFLKSMEHSRNLPTTQLRCQTGEKRALLLALSNIHFGYYKMIAFLFYDCQSCTVTNDFSNVGNEFIKRFGNGLFFTVFANIDRIRFDFFVTDNEHKRYFLNLCFANFIA